MLQPLKPRSAASDEEKQYGYYRSLDAGQSTPQPQSQTVSPEAIQQANEGTFGTGSRYSIEATYLGERDNPNRIINRGGGGYLDPVQYGARVNLMGSAPYSYSNAQQASQNAGAERYQIGGQEQWSSFNPFNQSEQFIGSYNAQNDTERAALNRMRGR